ncbi:MAG: hypothetical protein AAGF24_02285 [Cyanobacteria bacterium P01_H01_bin.121]
MVIAVVAINILIAALGVILCGYIIRWRRSLRQLTAALVVAEQACDQTLATAPEWFETQQQSIEQLQLRYQDLERQLVQLRQMAKVLRLGSRLLLFLGPRFYSGSVKLLSLR